MLEDWLANTLAAKKNTTIMVLYAVYAYSERLGPQIELRTTSVSIKAPTVSLQSQAGS